MSPRFSTPLNPAKVDVPRFASPLRGIFSPRVVDPGQCPHGPLVAVELDDFDDESWVDGVDHIRASTLWRAFHDPSVQLVSRVGSSPAFEAISGPLAALRLLAMTTAMPRSRALRGGRR